MEQGVNNHSVYCIFRKISPEMQFLFLEKNAMIWIQGIATYGKISVYETIVINYINTKFLILSNL